MEDTLAKIEPQLRAALEAIGEPSTGTLTCDLVCKALLQIRGTDYVRMVGQSVSDYLKGVWNMEDDDLEQQDEELVNYIADLL